MKEMAKSQHNQNQANTLLIHMSNGKLETIQGLYFTFLSAILLTLLKV